MRRFCPCHGQSESLYEEDLEIWKARAGWGTPTSTVVPDRADNYQPFPMGYTQGLTAAHGQHTCVLVLNLTERCNYACPTCYASVLAPGSRTPDPERPTMEEILHTVKTVIEREGGQLGVCMLSGGEPTVRRDLVQLIASQALCAGATLVTSDRVFHLVAGLALEDWTKPPVSP